MEKFKEWVLENKKVIFAFIIIWFLSLTLGYGSIAFIVEALFVIKWKIQESRGKERTKFSKRENILFVLLIAFILMFFALDSDSVGSEELQNEVNILTEEKQDLEQENKQLQSDKERLQGKVDEAEYWFDLTTDEKNEIKEQIDKERAEAEAKAKEEQEKKEKEEAEKKAQEEKEKAEEEARKEAEAQENQKSDVEKAKEIIEAKAKESFTSGTYDVVVKDNMVVLINYVYFTSNDSMDTWNELVETAKSVSIRLQNEVGDNVRFAMMIGVDYDHIYLMVSDGIVYYDVFNGIDLLGAGGTL